MTGYRYELYLDGEYQGVGIFQGLDELHLPQETESYIYSLFKDLTIPPPSVFNEDETTSYFTEKGNEFFEKELSLLSQIYEEDSNFNIKVVKKNIEKNDVLYEDEYQIITKGHNYFD